MIHGQKARMFCDGKDGGCPRFEDVQLVLLVSGGFGVRLPKDWQLGGDRRMGAMAPFIARCPDCAEKPSGLHLPTR